MSKKIMIMGIVLTAILALGQCSLSGGGDDDNTLAVAALAFLGLNSNNNATINITNSSGASATYTAHVSGSSCTNTATATTTVANNGTGALSVPPNTAGYNIKDGTNCQFVSVGTTKTTYTCTHSGGVISC